jgi:hypothetical protein
MPNPVHPRAMLNALVGDAHAKRGVPRWIAELSPPLRHVLAARSGGEQLGAGGVRQCGGGGSARAVAVTRWRGMADGGSPPQGQRGVSAHKGAGVLSLYYNKLRMHICISSASGSA